MKEELLELGMNQIVEATRDFLNEQSEKNLGVLTHVCGLEKCSNCEQWNLEDDLKSPEENSDIGNWCEQCRNDKF